MAVITNDKPKAPSAKDGEIRSQITRGIVALHKEIYGKGPVRIKACVHEDSVLVLMSGGFTPPEETLQEAGKSDAVKRQRMEIQEAVRGRLSAVVAEATGRSVIGFMSGTQPEAELQADVFVLDNTDLLGHADKGAGAEIS